MAVVSRFSYPDVQTWALAPESLGQSSGDGWVVIKSKMKLPLATIDGMLQIT